MSAGQVVVMSAEELERTVSRALAPLRLELERLRADRSSDPVSIPEAARRLGVTARTVQRWIKAGELKALQIGGTRRVVLPIAPTNG